MKDKTSIIRLQGHLHNEDKDILFRYCFRFHKRNTKSISLVDLGYVRGVLWFVGRPTSEDVREFLDAKKSKIDSLIFQDKCKKKTILNPATVEYQLNDSLFSSFNETSLLR